MRKAIGSAPARRILLLHNRYRTEGGEERAVREIAALLARRGHDVDVLERSSQGVGRARAGRALVFGGEDPAPVARAVRRGKVEIVHAHNLHPLLGWRALAAARSAGARTVLQLHNFRLFCAIAVAYRAGAPCFRCRGSNTLPGLRHRCRGSVGEAAVYAAGLRNQQQHIFAQADRLVVLSEAHGARLRQLGLPAPDTFTLPNFLPEASFAQASRADRGSYALVAGRLVEEKGFDTAIVAAKAAGMALVVAGEGPDEQRLRELAMGADVRFSGWLDPQALGEVRAGAAVALVPSRCEEACPYAVLDALAAGVPVLVSDRGGLPELVGEEAVLPAEDPAAWGRALASRSKDRSALAETGQRELVRARARFGEDRYYERLMALYSEL